MLLLFRSDSARDPGDVSAEKREDLRGVRDGRRGLAGTLLGDGFGDLGGLK